MSQVIEKSSYDMTMKEQFFTKVRETKPWYFFVHNTAISNAKIQSAIQNATLQIGRYQNTKNQNELPPDLRKRAAYIYGMPFDDISITMYATLQRIGHEILDNQINFQQKKISRLSEARDQQLSDARNTLLRFTERIFNNIIPDTNPNKGMYHSLIDTILQEAAAKFDVKSASMLSSFEEKKTMDLEKKLKKQQQFQQLQESMDPEEKQIRKIAKSEFENLKTKRNKINSKITKARIINKGFETKHFKSSSTPNLPKTKTILKKSSSTSSIKHQKSPSSSRSSSKSPTRKSSSKHHSTKAKPRSSKSHKSRSKSPSRSSKIIHSSRCKCNQCTKKQYFH
jgi:hypothetical protein